MLSDKIIVLLCPCCRWGEVIGAGLPPPKASNNCSSEVEVAVGRFDDVSVGVLGDRMPCPAPTHLPNVSIVLAEADDKFASLLMALDSSSTFSQMAASNEFNFSARLSRLKTSFSSS